MAFLAIETGGCGKKRKPARIYERCQPTCQLYEGLFAVLVEAHFEKQIKTFAHHTFYDTSISEQYTAA